MATRRLRVTRRAERSLLGLGRWTLERFGPRQAVAYVAELRGAMQRVADGTLATRSARAAWGDGVREDLHFVKAGSHVILLREREDEVVILDLLHDAMDLPRRVRG